MKLVLRFFMVICFGFILASCAGEPVADDGEFAAGDGPLESSANEFEDSAPSESESADSGDDLDSLDKDLEKEQKMADSGSASETDDPLVVEAQKDSLETTDSKTKNETGEKGENPSTVVSEEQKNPVETPPTVESAPAVVNSDSPSTESSSSKDNPTGLVQITNIKFEANDSGGSIIIDGNQPIEFSGRLNAPSNQFVVEIKNAKLPEKLKRPYITKDFPTSVGAIDAYQTPGSDIVKIVVQLREGSSEPAVHQEGNSIIVVPPPYQTNGTVAGTDERPDAFAAEGSAGLLSSKNLEQFLSGNMKYYGKKISLEVRDIEVRNAINLIAEESGANLIMSEGVGGNLSIKLKNVPWDQALVLILKAKKLGYTRQGNVLRISPLSELKQEEEDASSLVRIRKEIAPLKVQMVPINYAKIGDLKAQIEPLISKRPGATVVGDARTNSLILTDTDDVLDRVKKIISSLDIAPAQVLIEGKLVEARESFDRRIGIQWDLSGSSVSLGDGNQGPINMTPSLGIRPGTSNSASLGFNLSLGTLDLLGDLNAILALEEREENVRVISSPRIVTLHNEEAEIRQEAEVPYVTSAMDPTTRMIQKTVNFLKLIMNLKVVPEIANNGVVQLKVNMEREFAGAVVDETTGAASKHSRSAQTKVMVKSGQTAVIGGIYQNDSSSNDTGVPLLKDIPILGYLFRSSNFRKDKTELLLFLTPRILSQAGSGVASQDLGPLGKEPTESSEDTQTE